MNMGMNIVFLIICLQLVLSRGQYTTPQSTTASVRAASIFKTPRYTTPRFTTPRFTTPIFTTPTTTPVVQSKCTCQKLQVTGPEKYIAATLGFYTLQKCNYNGRPVYKHDDRNLLMYFSKSNFWAVGPAPDQGDVFIRVGDMAESPANVTLDWAVMAGMNSVIYKTDPSVKVSCACQAISCSRLSLGSNSPRASLAGHFVSTGELLNGRPTYSNSDAGLHLYLKVTSSCVYWAVGPEIDGETALMVVNDAALSPEQISGKWNVHLHSLSTIKWTREYDVILTCLAREKGY